MLAHHGCLINGVGFRSEWIAASSIGSFHSPVMAGSRGGGTGVRKVAIPSMLWLVWCHAGRGEGASTCFGTVRGPACVCVLSHFSCDQWPTLCNPMGCSPPGSSILGDSPGKNTEVGYRALLQGISPPRDRTQSLNGLLHWQVGSLSLAPPGKPTFTYESSIHTCSSLCGIKFPSKDIEFHWVLLSQAAWQGGKSLGAVCCVLLFSGGNGFTGQPWPEPPAHPSLGYTLREGQMLALG